MIKRIKNLKKDELTKNSAIMFVSGITAGGFNYFYQIYIGRNLSPEEYGIFGSLFAIFYIIGVISGTLSTSITQFTSRFISEGKQIGFLVKGSLKRFTIIGLITALISGLLIEPLKNFLNLVDNRPIYVLIIILILTWISPIIDGTLRGMKSFPILGLSQISGAFFKLSGVLLVILGFGVTGALAGVAIGTVISLSISGILLKSRSRPNNPHDPDFDYKSLYIYSLPVMLIMLSYTVPGNIDVLIVKYFFSPLDAGIYTSVSVLGKIILFLPGAIGTVMFPMIVQRHVKGENSLGLLKKSLIYTGLLSVSVSLIYLLFPGIVINTFGEKYQSGISLVGIYGLSMLFFSLIMIIANYHLAIRNMIYAKLLVISMMVEIMSLMIFHSTILEVATILMTLNFLILIMSLIYTRRLDKNYI